MDKTKAKIEELCPDVMELKFGCEVKKGMKRGTVIYDGWPNPDCFSVWWNGNQTASIFIRDEVEIFGSPITLAVVLRAMENTGGCDGMAIDRHGRFFNWLWKEAHEPYWNLEHDNYDQQSEECKQFIGSLLGV